MTHQELPQRSDVLIWAASSLLALLTGLGGAFLLWMALRTSALPMLANAAVLCVCVGLALVGLAIRWPLARATVLMAAAATAAGYALGGAYFASLFLT